VCIGSAMALFSPRLGVLALPVLTLVGCTAVGPGNEADEASVTPEDQTRLAQCERMKRLLGDRTLTPQQIEAVRARMNTNGCLVP
jgi:hypothetical protein